MPETIPFEIHLTTDELQMDRIADFIKACRQKNGKAILIQLSRGECVSQPMFTKTIYTDYFDGVLQEIDRLITDLQQDGYKSKRVKIEVPSSFSNQFTVPLLYGFAPYFEWHGKIHFKDVEIIKNVCINHKAHLSLNALRGESTSRFITLREFGAKEIFNAKVSALIQTLTIAGFQIDKHESEYCIYDNNVGLDKGWLPK